MTQDADLKEATRLHALGRLEDARRLYRAALQKDANDTRALHGLALIAIDQGRPANALAHLAKCLAREPANTLFKTSLGLALLRQGKADAAAPYLLEAANSAPHMAEPRLYLARALAELSRPADALKVLTSAAENFPHYADVWAAKGRIERTLLKHEAARESFSRALDLRPGDAGLLNDLGVIARAQGRTEEALCHYRAALAAAPDNPLTHGNLGNALAALGHGIAAEAHLRKAAQLAPDKTEYRRNLGVFLTKEERPGEAIPLFRSVLAQTPNDTDALTNLGVALLDTGTVAEAEAHLRRALALNPKNAEAHYNLAWILLLTGQWREGWQEYEWRWRLPHFSSRKRAFTAPAWDGAAIGGTLLLHAEQGLGDAIQFARYAPLARARCMRLVLECPRPLVSLLSGAAGIDAVIAAGDPLPEAAAHAPLMSLPRLFGTTPETVPPPLALAAARAATPFVLPATQRLRIGAVWAGSPDNKIDKRRSIPAHLFAPVLNAIDADVVSLQVGPRAAETGDIASGHLVFACEGRVGDFADTAAVIRQLDLVIGVDTAAIHLAGTLGIETWALLPFMPDYRWLLGRENTPWYPRARLFRQTTAGDWAGVMRQVRHALTLWKPS